MLFRSISTTQSKFGGSSISLDGNGDYLQAPSSNLYNFGTGDFTVEFWVYLNSLSQGAANSYGVAVATLFPSAGWQVQVTDSGNGTPSTIAWDTFSVTVAASSNALSATTWTHVAVTRASGSLRIFINGVQSGSTTSVTEDRKSTRLNSSHT